MKKLLIIFALLLFLPLASAWMTIENVSSTTGSIANLVASSSFLRGQNINLGINSANVTYNLTNGSLYIGDAGAVGTIKIHLAKRSGSLPTSDYIANATISSTVIPSSEGWVNFSFDNSVTLNNSFAYSLIAEYVDLPVTTIITTASVYPLDRIRNSGAGWFVEGVEDIPFYLYGEPLNPEPLVTLIAPPNATTTSETSLTFNASFNPSYFSPKYNLTNATLFIYNSTGIYNYSYTVVTGSSTNTSSLTVPLPDLVMTYTWNYKACVNNATVSNCSFASSNYTFYKSVSIANSSANNVTLETKSEFFSVIINILNGSTIVLPLFEYNGTQYPVSNIQTSEAMLKLNYTLDIPKLPTNLNTTFRYRWLFNISGSETQQATAYLTQNVSRLDLAMCNSTIAIKVLNVTTRKEADNTPLSTNMQATFNYWLGSGTVVKNFSTSITGASEYMFCLNENTTAQATTKQDYTRALYTSRAYNADRLILSNSTGVTSLYLLEEANATTFTFTVRQDTNRLGNSIVTINKFFTGEGIYKPISIRKTDDNGDFAESLQLNAKYNYIISINGTVLGVVQQDAICASAPCEKELQIITGLGSYLADYNSRYASSVVYSFDLNRTTNVITATFTDSLGLAQNFRVETKQTILNSTGTLTVCDQTVYAISGSASCNLTGREGTFTTYLYVSRSPEKLVYFFGYVITQAITTLKHYNVILSLFILITIAFVGFWNPATMLILIDIALIMLTYAQILPIGWPAVAGLIVVSVLLLMKIRT